MIRPYLIAALIILAGVLYFCLSYNVPENWTLSDHHVFSYDDIKNFNTGSLFLDIFLNNLLVGLMLSVFGFITGGMLSVVILFWNGYLLGIIYSAVFSIVPWSDIVYNSKHIPTELYALIIFATLGFQGFHFCKALLVERKICKQHIPKMKKTIFPIILLFVSAILEVL